MRQHDRRFFPDEQDGKARSGEQADKGININTCQVLFLQKTREERNAADHDKTGHEMFPSLQVEKRQQENTGQEMKAEVQSPVKETAACKEDCDFLEQVLEQRHSGNIALKQ